MGSHFMPASSCIPQTKPMLLSAELLTIASVLVNDDEFTVTDRLA
jgi:hypothetical protein